MTTSPWLEWVRRLSSIAQAGFTSSKSEFEQERYQQIQAIAEDIADKHTKMSQEKVSHFYQQKMAYITPKIGVRGIVFNDKHEMLLVKEQRTQMWTLPGGWADVWDTPAKTTEREIREETGYETKAIKLLALFDRKNQGYPAHGMSIWKAFFLCNIVGGFPQTSSETTDIGFFSEDNLPELDTRRILKKHILQFFEHHHDGSLPSDFD